MSTTEKGSTSYDHDRQRWSFTRDYAPKNFCRACGADMTSVELFEAHRVGEHDHLFSEEHPEGRRCLEEDELREKGYERDDHGRWFNPARVGRARQAFAAKAA